MTAPVTDERGKPREPSLPKPPADSEQVRRTRTAAQQTVDEVADTTERILRERDEGERPPAAAPEHPSADR
jgi:hypothetical protein